MWKCSTTVAIRLLCSLIKDSPREFIDEISNGSACFLDIIDDTDYPDDVRLNELIQILFNKLSDVEKEAFISLSVFGGAEFGLDAGIAIVGGEKFPAKRNIENLKKKSVIDVDGIGKMYAIHPLIQSFALKKGQNEMKNVLASSRARFFEYYINLFERLNMRFLKGDSMAAFKVFYMEEERIFSSLTDGLNDTVLLRKVATILGECELFLESLYHNNSMKSIQLYNYALSKVYDHKSHEDFARLYSSRKVFDTILVSKKFHALPEDPRIGRKIALLPLSVQGKLECCKGIYELSNGRGEPAAQRIEDGLLHLDNNPQHVILKILGFQFLAIYYKCTNNLVKCEQFANKTVEACTVNSAFRYVPLLGKPVEHEDKLGAPCFRDQPLAAWAIARLSLWTRKYSWVKLGSEFGDSLDSFLKQISGGSSKLVWTVELCSLLQLVDKAYIYLGFSNEMSSIDTIIEGVPLTNVEREEYQCAKDEDAGERRRLILAHERQATYCHTLYVQQFGMGKSSLEFLLKELKIRQQLPPDAKLVECYKRIGLEQYSRGEYSSAVNSFKSALQTLEELLGGMPDEVTKLYRHIKVAQNKMSRKK